MIPSVPSRRAGLFKAACFLALGMVATGCMTQEEWNRAWNQGRDKGAQPAADPVETRGSKAMQDTIGAQVTVQGMNLMEVKGYGLVVNLIDTGGSDAPDVIKQHIAKEIRRRTEPGQPGVPVEDWLKSRDTSIVEVTGFIPAAAEKGTRFDVVLRALGTQTKSLVGGRLFLCDLAMYADSPRGVLAGKTLATAEGPVFVSPFGQDPESPTRGDARVGVVMGGGRVGATRPVKLVLNTPRPSVTAQIRDRLNSMFTTVDPIAEAKNRGTVEVRIPPEYKLRRKTFLDLIAHITLTSSPAFQENRARELAREIEHPDAAYEAISLAWEAIGRPSLPIIQPLYAHPSEAVAYYAARAGLRLGDLDGMEAVARVAASRDSVLREAAIEELGYATKMYRAGERLRALLDDPDNLIRIKAYEGLLRHSHPAVQTFVLDDDNAILDVVDAPGPYLVYVRRTLAPRIAVFGKNMTVRPPAIYPASPQSDRPHYVQLTAAEGDRNLTTMYRNRRTGRVSPALPTSLNVGELVRFLGDKPRLNEDGELTGGLAVPYSEIVDVLYHLCKSRTIPATFLVERPSVSEQLPRDASRERPESEF